MSRRLLPCGPRAWLVETGEDPLGLVAAIRATRDDVIDVVPGARTVLVTFGPGTDVAAAGHELAALDLERPAPEESDRVVELPVTYDGEDLADVAAATGLTVSEVIERHAAATYHCAFCGFAPGFAYLRGLDPVLHLARRPTPRTRVPAGSVAIAAEYTAVYPTVSPGGWHLLGRTDATLWDVERDPPALIEPGTTVYFAPAS